jgi:glycosyltransferase involved in cell wall biosynthesis
MRIALLSTSRIGGAGTASIRSSEALRAVGVENDVFALPHQAGVGNFPIHTISRTPYETFQSKALTLLQKKLVQIGKELLTPLSVEPKAIKKILQEYDLVHIHSTYNILKHTGIESLLGGGKRIVITLHDQRWFTGGCHYSGNCERYLDNCHQCPQATSMGKHLVSKSFQDYTSVFKSYPRTKIISPSSWLGEKASKSRILAEANIRVIRNPIPDLDSEPLQSQDFEHLSKHYSKKRVVFIAENLQNPLKGLDILVNAFSAMSEDERRSFELLLIGNNPPDLKDISVTTRTENAQNSMELSNLLHNADLLVVPSLEDNLPNVIGEAYASGLKVLGSDVGGIPEVITSKTGETFQKGNHAELSSKLLNFNYDYPRREIKTYFDLNFSYAVVGKQIHNFYQE